MKCLLPLLWSDKWCTPNLQPYQMISKAKSLILATTKVWRTIGVFINFSQLGQRVQQLWDDKDQNCSFTNFSITLTTQIYIEYGWCNLEQKLIHKWKNSIPTQVPQGDTTFHIVYFACPMGTTFQWHFPKIPKSFFHFKIKIWKFVIPWKHKILKYDTTIL
jgi:hypothetical protein